MKRPDRLLTVPPPARARQSQASRGSGARPSAWEPRAPVPDDLSTQSWPLSTTGPPPAAEGRGNGGPQAHRLSGRRGFPHHLARVPVGSDVVIDNLSVAE